MSVQTKKIGLIVFGIGGVSAIVYSIVNKKINKKKDGRSYEFQRVLRKKLEPKETVIDPLFDTDKVVKSKVTLNQDEIKSIAKNIWKSWGWFNDSETKIYSQLRLCNTIHDYKEVAKEYIILSDGVSLDFDLKSDLSDDEYKIVQKIFDNYEK